VYEPNMPVDRAKQSALAHVAETFFDGSPAKMMASLLDEGAAKLSDVELDRLSDLIRRARRKEG
jgi:hypothetical protein